MKPIVWLGNSLTCLRSFEIKARRQIGYNLDKLQHNQEPYDWKPILEVGCGVREIRVHAGKEYRVIYVTKVADAIYVLHAFIKKTQQISKRDIDIIRQRYAEIKALRRI